MPTASQRPTPTNKAGASTASNETPVSTKEQPNPPADANTSASRPQNEAPDVPHVKSDPDGKANGRDHPTESEHDHAHQKLNGTSATRR